MSYLQKLRNTSTLEEVATLLGYKSKSFAYILYKMPPGQKYSTFDIPKQSGGTRCIRAPAPQLRELQRRLANVLYSCLEDIETSGKRRSLAHGFEKKRSIVTNATLHKRRRYVLNLDLEGFFPSFNFGRVRGFFIKDKNFGLSEKTATLLAQIACHENELPQGSPCSPVISNIIAHVLDARLARLAKAYKCTYSRYADDITFSTNQKEFPQQLAQQIADSAHWHLGVDLIAKIESSGFRINEKKTRMQVRGSRQMATGLVINEKVNIRSEYYRTARAMCHTLFLTGTYFRRDGYQSDGESATKSVQAKGLATLEGILAHIYHVKSYGSRQRHEKASKPSASALLFKKFLFYKNFASGNVPVIVPEGKTDSTYLRAAIRKLTAYHPQLGQIEGGIFSTSVRLLNCTRTVRDLLRVGCGTGNLKQFIADYKFTIKKFVHAPMEYPVILVIDNDDGANDVFKVLKEYWLRVSHGSREPFYYVCSNLYIIKTPEGVEDPKTCIEDLFPPELLKVVIDGKEFDPRKEHDAAGKYGKHVFAEKVVKPNIDTIDFSRFGPLLDRIVKVLDDYQARRSSLSSAPPASTTNNVGSA